MLLRIATRIAAERVRSLVWEGDTLVDWVAGGIRYGLDGETHPRAVNYAYHFDAACGSPSGRYAIIYERLGTKGVILDNGKVLREINRSFYHADVYEYPVCIARLESGREVLIHCPEDYNRLEIDEIETGERLTDCDGREPVDYFHSRLALSPKGLRVLSAGWVWHPFDALAVFELDEALRDPKSVDDFGRFPTLPTEISSATFVDEQRLVISTSDESFLDEEDFADDNVLRPSSVALWDIDKAKIISQAALVEPAGTLMAVDLQFVVGFHEHPKMVDLQTGKVVSRLDDLESGKQTSSVIHHLDSIPPLALDPGNRRFALAAPDEVLVIEVTPD